MKILVIDGQGGKMGAALTDQIKKNMPDVEVVAVGTNSPVSYTHLLRGKTETISTCHTTERKATLSVEVLLFFVNFFWEGLYMEKRDARKRYTQTVSYTHLDVYKRQAYRSENSPNP